MKTRFSAIILFMVCTIFGLEAKAMEIDRSIMHTDDEADQVIITEDSSNAIFGNHQQQEEAPDIYEVQNGDNLFRIAVTHDVQVDELMEWNNLNNYIIHPGEEIILEESSRLEETRENASTREVQKADVQEGNKGTAPDQSAKEEMIMNATAYTAYCEGCSGTTAIGIDLRSNPNQKVIAVDPNIIPLGSKVWVEGYGEAIAADTGGAIKGNKIDVFIPTQQQALEWGRKQVKVRIYN